ncbi:MAG: T9SS type A sorting domain-containing protein [Ignavibacteriaceae bacterium]|nr:T9SS type A sorting domain-containing protein [Ignavibacteriaceae bacterium]
MKNVLYKLIMLLSIVLLLQIDVGAQEFENGEIGMSLSGAGRVRVFAPTTTTRQIDRSSIIVTKSPSEVYSYNADADNEDTVRNVVSPQFSDFEIFGSSNNAWSNLPPDVLVKNTILGWNTGGFSIVKFTVVSREAAAFSSRIGMEIIAQVEGSYGLESVKWLSNEKIMSIFRLPASTNTGYKLLSASTATVKIIDWYDGYDSVDTDMYSWMYAGIADTLFDSGGDGAVAFFSQDEINLAPGDSATVYIGISVGADEAAMVANMGLAEEKYATLTDVKPNNEAAINNFSLLQNYPNPFNPSTRISYNLPQREFVTLGVYNMLGQKVASLINNTIEAGAHTVNFDAHNLTSGVYVYKINAGQYSQSMKMILIK